MECFPDFHHSKFLENKKCVLFHDCLREITTRLQLRTTFGNCRECEVLEQNTQMLHEQLDLLCHVPGCEKAAQDSPFWQQKCLRRGLLEK